MLLLTASTDCLARAQSIIESEYRLNELVELTGQEECVPGAIQLTSESIDVPIDWTESLPPLLLYSLSFTPNNLLAVVFLKLGNWEKAYANAQQNQRLLATIDAINRLQSGMALVPSPEPLTNNETNYTYRRWHNRAVSLHYGYLDIPASGSEVVRAYEQAIAIAPDADYRAYTTRHFATFLLDNGLLKEADEWLARAQVEELSEVAAIELKAVQYAVWLQQVIVPYDQRLLVTLKETMWEVLAYYEREQRTIQTGLLLLDAAQVANFSESFSESLGYVNRAIAIFRAEELPELVANAQYRKGILLFFWAQKGNPQFYRPAMEAYQEALKVFTQQVAPEIFAEIQHHLGVIYSEIPDEAPKKGIWAAVSTSSFKQALAYFTRQDFPYVYATICNHYGNAITKYPDAKLGDKYAKALELYAEALTIRTAEAYPYERALTLLNYLEAAWFVAEADEAKQGLLLDDMIDKAAEVSVLVADPALLADAQKHLTQLVALRQQPA